MPYTIELSDQKQELGGTSGRAKRKVIAVTFREQTPKIWIGQPVHDPLYEKAFLIPRAESDDEFGRNTCTWD